jgi:hypothetical protein
MWRTEENGNGLVCMTLTRGAAAVRAKRTNSREANIQKQEACQAS